MPLADATPAALLAAAAWRAGALAVTIATSEPQKAIEIIAREPGVTRVAIAERVNGVTHLLVHRRARERPSATALVGVLGRAEDRGR